MPWLTPTGVRDFGAQDGQALLPVRSATTVGVRGGGASALPLANATASFGHLHTLRSRARSELASLSAQTVQSGLITKPVRSFGVKNVLFGGIRTPSRAVRSISATVTGRIRTAAAASPPSTALTTSSSPCW